MAKLVLVAGLFALTASAAQAGDAGVEQITHRSDHRGFAAAVGAPRVGVQMSQVARTAVARDAAPEFAGRAEVRGIGAPVLGPNVIDRVRDGEGHSDTISQLGEGNIARLTQSGTGHVARLLQTGMGHRGEISQTGTGHFASLSQAGESSVASIVQTGGFASALVSQSGAFNTVSIRQ